MNIPHEKVRKIHLIYSIILSICIIIAGLCLICACISIYNSGEHPFSRVAVAIAFSKISFPVYLCLILTIIGFIFDIICSTNSDKVKNTPDYVFLLNKMYDKRDIETSDSELVNEINSIKNKRKLLRTINIVIVALCSALFLIYALNDKNFHQSEINDSMIKAMYVLIPCLLVSFSYTLFFLYYNEKSIKKELDLLKQLPIKENTESKVLKTDNRSKLKYVVLVIAIALLVYGVYAGGTADVLTKAVNICTECIGLG